MEGVGQLTKKICLAGYHQIEHLQCLPPSPPCRTWGGGGAKRPKFTGKSSSETKKENLVSAVPLSLREERYLRKNRQEEEKASNISWPRAVFSDPLDGCEAIWL